MKTLGNVFAEARRGKKLSLAEVCRQVVKEDGAHISTQYLHDIEHERRVPGPSVLAKIAEVLGIDCHVASALAKQTPASITTYLSANPDQAPRVAAFFERAITHGFDWGRS